MTVSFVAQAGLTDPPRPPQPIWGGTEVPECGWPTTVFMGSCTGTLVHPEVIVFASHCLFSSGGTGPDFATFGENIYSPQRTVAIDSCTMFPGWIPEPSSFGDDIAFCLLSEPMLDIPIVPILMGCETEMLVPGAPVTLVGYGVTNDDGFGRKHEVTTQVNGFDGPELEVGGNGTGACNGDSGGPAYIQLPDGSWRVFGVTSRGTASNCAFPSIYGLIHSHTQWIENETAIDITPCHDADGTWNPDDRCHAFPLTPAVGESCWEQGCALAQLSAPSASCGDPIEEPAGGGSSSGGGTCPDESTGAASGDATGLPGDTGADSTGPAPSPATDSTGGTAGDAGQGGDDMGACSCRTDAPAPAAAWLLLPLLAPRRRRRAR
ncbi:MAG: trypsin-like serine protease [Deltaproteobacteria bacterium]|nr:trypsin-like serine protease [Deltaproteobacteria bacterium]